MTLQQAKDEIAIRNGYPNWDEFIEKNLIRLSWVGAYDEAAELYAKSKWDEAIEVDRNSMKFSMPVGECKAWDFVLWAKNHFESENPEFNP